MKLPATLPPGWAHAEFGSLIEESQNGCSARRGTGTPTVVLRLADVTIEGVIAAESLREIPLTDAERKKYALIRGDLLAFRVNGSPQITGHVVCYPGPEGFAYCDHFIRFRLRDGTLLPALAAYAFRAWPARDQVASGMVSTAGQNTVSQKTYSTIQLLLPPIREQQQIVEAIESYSTRLDDAVATLERVERNLKRYRASVLKSAVEGRLVPTEAALAKQEGRTYEPASVLLERILTERRRCWSESGKKGKYQEPTPPDTTKLPKLPEGWCWASVDQLGESVTGTTPATAKQEYYGGSLPFLKPTDLNAGYTVVSARESLSEEGARQARTLPGGSVLVTCIGATIGKTGLTRVECATNQQINALVPDEPLRAVFYLYWFFVSPFGQSSVIGNASSTTIPILNKSRFERIAVPLPPLSEQTRVISELERIFSLIDGTGHELERAQRKCGRLRQSILKWAFEGKLADQDPNDEPASVLLERIRAERNPDKPAKSAPSQRKAAKKKARA